MNRFIKLQPNCCSSINCRLLSTRKTSDASKAKLRSSVVSDIAKQFNNVALVNFPISKLEDLSRYSEIEKIHQDCHGKQLDHNPNYYPSISTILNKTMPISSIIALKRWEAEKIKQLGIDGFQIYKKELFSRGKILHNNISNYLETRDTSKLNFTSNKQENIWKSIEHVLSDVGPLYASEFPVYHPFLKYRGILDCLASYHQVPAIFEWKTSEKLRPTIAHTYDNPLQTVAYYACLQYDQVGCTFPDIKEAILVIAYEDGSKANVHMLESSFRLAIWKKFLNRLEQFWIQMAR